MPSPSGSPPLTGWRWALAIALLTIAVSSIPLAAGYAAQKPGRVFVGAVNDIQDYHSHLAKMQLGARGELAYRSLFTPEPMQPHRVILFYNVLGWIAARLDLSLPLMYEIGRWAGGLALLMMAWWFLSLCLPDLTTRRWAYALAIVSSGVGWLLIKSPWFSFPRQSPMDFWLIDAYTFFSIFVFPHFGFSIAALLLGLIAWWRWIETRRPVWLVLLAVGSFMQGFAQIFELPVLDLVIGFDALRRLARDRSLWTLGAALLVLPILAVTQVVLVRPYLDALFADSLFQAWSGQHPAYSPGPSYYLEGYGLIWPFVILGLVVTAQERNGRLALGAVWLGTVALLVYSPTSIQYRWLEGVQVPLGLFAAVGLASLFRSIEQRWRSSSSSLRVRVRWWSITLLLVLLSVSHLYLVAGSAMLAAGGWKDYFLSSDEAAAINFIGAQPPGTTLAAYRLSNALPARTGRQVFFGHWAETIGVETKREQVNAFYSTMTDDQRRALLREYDLRFVVHSSTEKQLGDFDPVAAPYLVRRFQSGDVAVYQVTDP